MAIQSNQSITKVIQYRTGSGSDRIQAAYRVVEGLDLTVERRCLSPVANAPGTVLSTIHQCLNINTPTA